ncbi:MAG: NUDIX domain-containing protein [Kiritimatiellae bacterium]|nr:NUDIX domain-containing protein [Kiritimatiellia bacterium]
MTEYELAGIEIIARGVCVQEGKILLCRANGGATTYLPGGHVEFGETGRQALVREVKEEMGVDSETGAFLGVVENAFEQHGKPHAEINLVYELKIPAATPPRALESWIEFEWRDLARLDDLLPAAFRRLSNDSTTPFAP